ncbi:hypothetical protein Q3G72_033729 [Acer saccharum]|nr:hypothetical protein Q3G72_033729 [Acer saccharum]
MIELDCRRRPSFPCSRFLLPDSAIVFLTSPFRLQIPIELRQCPSRLRSSPIPVARQAAVPSDRSVVGSIPAARQAAVPSEFSRPSGQLATVAPILAHRQASAGLLRFLFVERSSDFNIIIQYCCVV